MGQRSPPQEGKNEGGTNILLSSSPVPRPTNCISMEGPGAWDPAAAERRLATVALDRRRRVPPSLPSTHVGPNSLRGTL